MNLPHPGHDLAQRLLSLHLVLVLGLLEELTKSLQEELILTFGIEIEQYIDALRMPRPMITQHLGEDLLGLSCILFLHL